MVGSIIKSDQKEIADSTSEEVHRIKFSTITCTEIINCNDIKKNQDR